MTWKLPKIIYAIVALTLLAFTIDFIQSAPLANAATGHYGEVIKNRIINNTVIVKKKDKSRIFDCSSRSRSTYPLKKFKINYFNSLHAKDEKTGFITSNGWPMLLSFFNYQRYSNNSRLFVGFRGVNWGIHKTPMTTYMRDFIRKYFNNDTLLLPDSYLFVDAERRSLKKDNVMVVCHGRTYSGGRHIDSYWPGLADSGGWNIIDRFFKSNRKVHLLGWSNGASPRSQFLETRVLDHKSISYKKIKNHIAFLNYYSSNTEFISKQQHRIEGVLDIETNYSNNKSLWNVAKFIKEFVVDSNKAIYYGTCSLYGENARNYVRLIQAFNLKGKENKRGIIRYSNARGNIVIDLVALHYKPFYSARGVNLLKDTEFERSKKKVKYRFIDHVRIVGFSLKRYAALLKKLQAGREDATASVEE